MNDVVKQEKINKILKDDNYINWLEQFTSDIPKFYCDNYFYDGSTYPNELNQNIQDISLFYEIIKNYAENNYISPVTTVCGNYYSIQHNNIGYHIGTMEGPEILYYCISVDCEESYINFKDIQNNTLTPNAIFINHKIEELANIINDMIDNNVNRDIISNVTNKTLQKVLKK